MINNPKRTIIDQRRTIGTMAHKLKKLQSIADTNRARVEWLEEKNRKLREERDFLLDNGNMALQTASEKLKSVEIERDIWNAKAEGREMAVETLKEDLQSAQQEIEQLRYRDRIVSLANETLGRYVREGKQEIERLKVALHIHQSYDKTVSEMHDREQKLIEGLRNIDTHIRSTHDPIPYIVQTVKGILPEYGVVTE